MTVMVKHACHSQADSRHAPTTIISYVLIVDRRTSMLTDTAAISQLFFILLHLKHVLFVAKLQQKRAPESVSNLSATVFWGYCVLDGCVQLHDVLHRRKVRHTCDRQAKVKYDICCLIFPAGIGRL